MLGGGEVQKARQHANGKLTARERIDAIFDQESFIENQVYIKSRTNEFGMDAKKFYGDGVVTGCGTIGGRQVCVSSQDFSIVGGSLGEMHAHKIAEAQELALRTGSPFVQINDSGGARIQEGILSLNGYARIFRNNTFASGVIPQFSLILGPCAGGAVYSPALTDFIFMVDNISHMYITGPDVIRTVTGEVISHEELGGAATHCRKSGVAHFRFATEQECFAFLRKLITYLPSSNRELPPVVNTGDPANRSTPGILSIIPDNPRMSYDVRDIIQEIADKDSFIEIQKDWAMTLVIGFARLDGRTVGIFGNQPKHMAAVLDIDSSDKGSRFIRFCDAFNIPLISLVDVPGYLPGVTQEYAGIIRHGAKMLYAVSEATVPKIALIMRKSYGGSMIAMSAKALGYDRVLAYPTAEIAVMGAESAASIIFHKEIQQSENPEQKRMEKIAEFQQQFMNPYSAAALGLVDDIIDPEETRKALICSLRMNYRKKEERPVKKHGVMPV